MAMYAKDGSRHHSASRAKLHDEIAATKGKAPEKPAAVKPIHGAGKPPEQMGAGRPEPSPHTIEEHVSRHGPAHKMTHEHDRETGKHHVTTHHGEGEDGMHHSVHDTAEAAHDHMGTAMGIGGESAEAEPFGGTETPEEEQAEERASKGRIPGIAA